MKNNQNIIIYVIFCITISIIILGSIFLGNVTKPVNKIPDNIPNDTTHCPRCNQEIVIYHYKKPI